MISKITLSEFYLYFLFIEMESSDDAKISPVLLIHYLSIPQTSDTYNPQDETQDNESLRSEDAEIYFK